MAAEGERKCQRGVVQCGHHQGMCVSHVNAGREEPLRQAEKGGDCRREAL